MRRALAVMGLISVAACGALIGHGLTYLFEGRVPADGRHGYLLPTAEVAAALLATFGAVHFARAMRITERGLKRTALPLFGLWLTLATLQVGGFAILELVEGNAPDILGWGIEVAVALVAAVAVALFNGFVERCIAAIAAAYLKRVHAMGSSLNAPIAVTWPGLQLAVSAGIYRFKRPPPITIS